MSAVVIVGLLTLSRLPMLHLVIVEQDDDAIARAIEKLGTQALAAMPQNLLALPQDQVALRAFDTVGVSALRALLIGDSDLTGGVN